MKQNQKTAYLMYQAMKVHENSWHMPQQKGFGCLWEKKSKSCSVRLKTFQMSLDLRIAIRLLWGRAECLVDRWQVSGWRCKRYGHRTGDKECPFFIKGNQKLEQFRVAHEDPMYDIIRENKRHEKELRIQQLKQLLEDSTSEDDDSSDDSDEDDEGGSSSTSSECRDKHKKKKRKKEKKKKEKKKKKKRKRKSSKSNEKSESD
ncbi:retinitis pigmentosa 9 protein isoform X3 [Patagioenas fasciata]|uniref:retinitis pigmentosa 9 protein isoform X3 n=1 Tax=Patagioenas fasciata TaxID=372321 RepID=UPI003A9A50F3